MASSSAAAWVKITSDKQEIRKALIPADWTIDATKWADANNITVKEVLADHDGEILSAHEMDITEENDAVDIVEKIRSRQYGIEEVTRAFCKRAAIAHQLTNCLTEIFFDQAIQRARVLDQARLDMSDGDLPPLFGLPVSVKDTYHVAGTDATIGFANFAFEPSTSHSPLVELLERLGAVLYCKTNVSQTLMTADSQNNLFGRTTNPRNRALTAGGSTGGEGPLIALHGSVLGFGTDLGGRVRIPALCNGIYGFKPSSCIIPFSGQRMPFIPGWEGVGIVASAGPLATSARACIFAMRTLMNAVPADLDPSRLRIPWLHNLSPRLQDPKQLRIGVVEEDGFFTPSPPVRRGLSESIDKLKNSGITIIQLALPLASKLLEVTGKMLGTHGSEYVIEILGSTEEPPIPSVRQSSILDPVPPMTMGAYYDLNLERLKLAQTYSALWISHELDAIIMPPAPFAAVPHDQWATASYTSIWNLLDYPAFLLPVGEVSKEDVVDDISNAKHGGKDENVYKLYTGPEDYANVPIALQVIGKKQDDQALMVVAGVVDEILKRDLD